MQGYAYDPAQQAAMMAAAHAAAGGEGWQGQQMDAADDADGSRRLEAAEADADGELHTACSSSCPVHDSS